MTRFRANFSIGKKLFCGIYCILNISLFVALVWVTSLILSLALTAGIKLQPEIIADVVILVSVNFTHTLPVILLSIIYTKIFNAAHTNSERARRNSAVR